MTDEVLLEGMRFYGYHGVNPEERALGQRFSVDVAIEADLSPAGMSDDLSKTVNYSKVFKRVREIVEGEPRDLLESVAEGIAAAVLDDFPPATAVTVTIRKPGVAVREAILDAAGVRIRRRRAAGAS